VSSQCLHTKYTHICRPIQHLGKKWAHHPIYKNKYTYVHHNTTHCASKAPPPAPPSGSGGPPTPTPGGGGPPPTGPSCPGGSFPARHCRNHCFSSRNGPPWGWNPTHCSRNVSSWILDHRPSGTSCSTIFSRRRMSS
jgi:hypothetical protein